MKIKHLRDIQRRPFATIVQDDNGHFGVSICNDNDRFNKKLGVKTKNHPMGDTRIFRNGSWQLNSLTQEQDVEGSSPFAHPLGVHYSVLFSC